jgi:1-deoxy-D-xylulose-5-phosphate reductoisomerase
MNAANEAAVAAFVSGNITFGEISRLVELTIDRHQLQAQPSLDDLLEADRWARETVQLHVASRIKVAALTH